MTQDVFKACRILFGSEIELSLDFLLYLQSSGIKSAYRKRALQTHPDLLSAREGVEESEAFIETHWAYKRLLEYIGTRDTRAHARKHPPMRHAGSVFHPRRQRPRKRARRTATHRPGGFFFVGTPPRRRLMFGEFLFYSGHVSWESLIKAITWQRRQRPRLGEIARDWGLVDEIQIIEGFRERRLGEPIGESLARVGHLSREHLDAILRKQRMLQRPMGEYFVINGVLSQSEISAHLKSLYRHNAKYPDTV